MSKTIYILDILHELAANMRAVELLKYRYTP
jgi:hypothetical protein